MNYAGAYPAPSSVILLAENEPTFSHFAQVMLAGLGYEVIGAKSGAEAVAIYSHLKDQVDLVLLDTLMPGPSGAQTVTALRTIKPGVKVLLCGNCRSDKDVDTLLGQGCRGFIQKPYNFDQLASQVSAAVS
ncbi:MAG: response regulator [Desulfobacterales bacterium]|jgi:CheY-like chemotaxis protein